MAKSMWWASAAAYVAVIVWAAFVLPAQGVVSHLGADGTPDDVGSRVEFIGVNIGIMLLMLVVTPWIISASTRMPAAFLNMPRKDYWLAPERADATLALVRSHLWWVLAATNLVVVAAMLDLVSLTLQGRELFGMWPFVVYMVGVLAWTVWFIRHFNRVPE